MSPRAKAEQVVQVLTGGRASAASRERTRFPAFAEFVEKPADPPGLPDSPDESFVSMGNYIFKTPALLSELARDAHEEQTSRDFGKDILATAHERLNVFAYDFNDQICPGESDHSRGYWRDVGTIDSYFEANMDLQKKRTA